MINGLDFSSWEDVTDAQELFNAQLPIDFAYIRAHTGFGDDEKFPRFRAILRDAKTPRGSVLWGPYMFLGYSGKAGSRTWNAVRGDYQAQNCWDLATAGGREFQLPVAVDCENIAFVEGGVRQYLPMPSAYAYCDTYLVPAIEFLSEKQGRRPVFYSSPNVILNYLAPVLSKPEFAAIGECGLWLAQWTKTPGAPSYMKTISERTPWKSYLIHQYVGDVKDYPGITAVDLNRGVGTRGQWKAWIADATKFPAEGAVEPPPVDPPVEPPAEPSDLAARVADLEAWQARVRA